MPLFPTREYHPAVVERKSNPKRRKSSIPQIKLPKDKTNLDVEFDDKVVKLTNLNKLFWPKLGSHEARPDSVLPRRGAGAAPSPDGSRDGDEALSERRGG